jgi:hypothetical protein
LRLTVLEIQEHDSSICLASGEGPYCIWQKEEAQIGACGREKKQDGANSLEKGKSIQTHPHQAPPPDNAA